MIANYTISVTDIEVADDRRAIAAPLVAHSTHSAGNGDYRHLAVLLKGDEGAVVGGLWGHTAYGWLTIYLMAIPAAWRGQGIGTSILMQAECEAARRGCTGAWLDTFKFQAPGFYERSGYTRFAELEDYPVGSSRIFMKKLLRPG